VNDWAPDGNLETIGSELRASLAAELRAEAEDRERDAAIAHRRGRTLHDVLADARARGDRLSVEVAGRSYVGQVTHVGADVATVEIADGTLDLSLDAPLTLRTVALSAGPGRGPDASRPATFRARLLELELAGTEVEALTATVTGGGATRIRAVARDHVLLEGEGDPVVSLRALRGVLVRSDYPQPPRRTR
jgi:hypothetical protein